MNAVIVSGLVSGSLYALVACGLSLVWGSLGVFNFAHGVLLMSGAYAAWWVSSSAGLDLGLPVGVVASILFMTAVGGLTYLLLVKPWIHTPGAELSVIMTTIAGSIFVENLALEMFGARLKTVEQIVSGTVSLGGTVVQSQNLLTILIAPLLLGGLAVFLKRSKNGLAIRAIAQNRDAAQLLGINVDRVYFLTFGVSAALAGVAGILIGGLFNIGPSMGTSPFLRAFIVVVFGGLGSLPGTVLGAYAVGLIEAASAYYIGIYWTPVALFAVLILVLIVRPNGLMGRAL